MNDFSFCPKCGQQTVNYINQRHWICKQCGFDLYHNVAASVALIILLNNKILMVMREKEPSKGMLALPGGVIDPGERAEEAAFRECMEEIGLVPHNLNFVASFPNLYNYGNILYNTCDFFFTGHLDIPENLPEKELLSFLKPQKGEIAGFCLLDISQIKTAPIAFSSLRCGLLEWYSTHKI